MINIFNDKNIFIIPKGRYFSTLLMDSLIHKVKLDSNKTVALVFKKENHFGKSSRYYYEEGITYIDYESCNFNLIYSARSITFFSLEPYTSKIISRLINEVSYDIKRIYCWMSGDDVKRLWNQKISNGKIQEGLHPLINEDVCNVFKNLENYICPYKPFGERIEKLSGKRVNILNVTAPFGILLTETEMLMHKINQKKNKNDDGYFSIIIGNKPQQIFNSIKWIWFFLISVARTNNPLNNLRIGLWVDPLCKEMIILIPILRLLQHYYKKKGGKLEIQLLQKVSPEIYYLRMTNCDLFIARLRGGGTTIKEILRWGKLVAVPSGDWNHIWVRDFLGVYCISFKNEKEIVKKIINKNYITKILNQNNENSKYKNKITKYEEKSIKYFTQIYKYRVSFTEVAERSMK